MSAFTTMMRHTGLCVTALSGQPDLDRKKWWSSSPSLFFHKCNDDGHGEWFAEPVTHALRGSRVGHSSFPWLLIVPFAYAEIIFVITFVKTVKKFNSGIIFAITFLRLSRNSTLP
ncbi:hypothetical protein Syun_029370 [Stephania yunnanensis]|uniref:Uncharacterized protein n=1 Tax=Stephania yunnanensis TaxID=152371 RepID=A0AAP0E5H6_9MAGN